MIRTLSLAAAQTIPRRGDVDANIEQHVQLVQAAAEERTRVVVFPELSLTGYELDLADALAFAEGDARLDPLVAAAASYQITIIVGAPVRLGPRLHIGAFILAPDHTVGLYTKRHMGAGEEALQAGDRSPLVQVGGNTAAVAVCADANHAAHPRDAEDRGADTYLVSTFVTPRDMPARTANLRTYAAQHSMAVVFANYGGPSGGLASGGRSAIWSEKGELLAQLDEIGAGLVVATGGDAGWSATTRMLHR